MRGRKSIGYELGMDVVENLVFPQAVAEKFVQLGVSACGLRASPWKQNWSER